MFLLFGDNYVKDGQLGKECHKRVAFENNLRKVGKTDVLRNFYHSLAKLNLGRQIMVMLQKNRSLSSQISQFKKVCALPMFF